MGRASKPGGSSRLEPHHRFVPHSAADLQPQEYLSACDDCGHDEEPIQLKAERFNQEDLVPSVSEQKGHLILLLF